MVRMTGALALLALAGCATGPHVERSQRLPVPVAAHVDVEMRLTQHQMNVSYAQSTAGGAAGLQAAASPAVAAGGFAAGAAAGLIGALIDAAVTAHRSGVAENMATPMREHLRPINVDELICRSMDALDRRTLAGDIAIECLDRAEADDADQKRIEARSNVLVVSPVYSVSYDGTSFTYTLAAKLVDRIAKSNGKIDEKVRYRQTFQYVLTAPQGARWEDLSADQWKPILEQAAAEAVAMLNYDIGAQPSDAQPRMKYGPLIVLLDQNKGDRSWVRTHFSLASVPAAELKSVGAH